MSKVARLRASGFDRSIDPVERPHSLREIFARLGVFPGSTEQALASLPFGLNDTTAGSENELQAAVIGDKGAVDLPNAIERSNFFANIARRAAAGETSHRALKNLEGYLSGNAGRVWENSWVRFPLATLSPFARQLLEADLLADKAEPEGGLRSDCDRFLFTHFGEKWLRVPISYLIKLALADLLGTQPEAPPTIGRTGRQLLNHFSNDNTSPETYSFHVIPLRPASGMGRAVAREAAKRFLLVQLLTMYANEAFGLLANGQRAVIYSAPQPPVRQRELNECISDAFYRELFMSPCLSGWDRGEDKHAYMHLCHQVLSRSQLNAIAKLREAGIITSNLIVLPNLSNISLANNGTHISLGSLRLTRALKDRSSGVNRADEKLLGDLVIKIVEHFLPLFVGTFSAAPCRMDFGELHPERALGFLPHELDYTHLRMLWRRWKKKAHLKVLGHPITPFGPEWLDALISSLFGLKGDFIPDFRLIDYFVALMSTDRSPALDGRLGNGERLKQDLADLGVFDRKMALYLLYRLRECHTMGFSGFEGRTYSLFESFTGDMGPAADLQTLITALAFKLIAEERVSHAHIPDDPSVESERRQIFFGTAVGVPTFFVRQGTQNLFLKGIIERCPGVRRSRRYPGYLRVFNFEYRKTLLRLIEEEAADLIAMHGLEASVEELGLRITHPEEHATYGKLTRAILGPHKARHPMQLSGKEFNQAAEDYYRQALRRKHLEEAFLLLEEDIWELEARRARGNGGYGPELQFALKGRSALELLQAAERDVLEESAPLDVLRALINLVLVTIDNDIAQAKAILDEPTAHDPAPVHRAALG